ncbi:MAG: hypothetical protein EHM42_03010 [Planctomycetaceae bacterium]|nr:MAG: hypothetical protein EHM42_03010 [Planctomycetaceae bacterium]
MRVETVQQFIELVRHSQLLSAEQIREAEGLGATDAQSLARKLFRRGWITRWQALTLLDGRRQFFLGKYKLLELIGAGGMGAVFKATQPELGRVVAIKVLKPKVVRRSTGIPRFLREIRSAAALDHPNIVRALDADKFDDTYALVMEYIDGRDLKSHLTGKPDLPVGWVCECMRQAALGLQHAAERGTVHRDIKPANLIVAEADGRPLVKILDFGLARFASEGEADEGLTRLGQAVGTPDYISPEQAQNSSLADIRSDIYSLGCTFFELLTGTVPFPTGSLAEKLVARIRSAAPPVSSLRPEIPRKLNEVVARMLAGRPEDRYQTPAEVARDLAEFARATGAENPTQNRENPEGSEEWESPPDPGLGAFLETRSGSAETEENWAELSESAVRLKPQSWRRAGLSLVAIVVVAGLLLLAMNRQRKKPIAGPPTGTTEAGRKGRGPRADAEEQPAEPGFEAAVALLRLGATLRATTEGPEPGSIDWPPAELAGPPRQVVEINNPLQLAGRVSQIVGAELRINPHVTNVTVSRLTELPTLEEVVLSGCRLTDSCVSEFTLLPALRHLDLSSTPLTDSGLRSLGSLATLEHLDLSRTPMNGEALGDYRGLSRLRRLNLGFTKLAPAALRHVEQLASLESLSLEGTKLPPVAIEHLERCKQLKALNLKATGVPDSMVARLAQALPDCRIEH